MVIELWEKVIERHHCPSNREVDNTIKSISKKFVTKYHSDSVPRVGDVISVKQSKRAYVDWEVFNVIREIRDHDETVILEVKQYDNRKFYRSGSDSWFENIPLVTDIED